MIVEESRSFKPEPVRPETVTLAPSGLEGYLRAPKPGRGVVLFAHGSGSGRNSVRNQFVAGELERAGLGTLLFDLLMDDEAQDRSKVFDIDLLARRLVLATSWLEERLGTRGLPVGYFGASTGAAAALVASTVAVQPIGAIVSRGGRPDLAGGALSRITAPTLLIVGSEDRQVLALNERALSALPGEKEIAVVSGATHLFEEAGTLEEVARLAARWFSSRLPTRPFQ